MILLESHIASVKGFVRGTFDFHSAIRTTMSDFLLFWGKRNIENDEATEVDEYGVKTSLPPIQLFPTKETQHYFVDQ